MSTELHGGARVKRAVAIGLGLCMAIGVSVVIAAGSMLSRPVRASIGLPPSDLNAQPVAFRSRSGERIRGWLSLPAKRAKATVILLPGVRANRLSMVGRARFLHAAGYAVLLIATARAHGRCS